MRVTEPSKNCQRIVNLKGRFALDWTEFLPKSLRILLERIHLGQSRVSYTHNSAPRLARAETAK
jgi:hypothetical protein